MIKNQKFFKGRLIKDVLKELGFQKHLDKLQNKLQNKKIAVYGAGIMTDEILNSYDLKNFNIIGFADKKFNGEEKYFDYNTFSPKQLAEQNIDIILISTQYPYKIYKYLKKEIYKNKKSPKIYFLLNKPLGLYVEEIFQSE